MLCYVMLCYVMLCLCYNNGDENEKENDREVQEGGRENIKKCRKGRTEEEKWMKEEEEEEEEEEDLQEKG